jgi:hypothetical protein
MIIGAKLACSTGAVVSVGDTLLLWIMKVVLTTSLALLEGAFSVGLKARNLYEIMFERVEMKNGIRFRPRVAKDNTAMRR